MSEDLAIDVGLDYGKPEYRTFVDSVNNILKYGCSHIDEKIQDIIDKCQQSELEIAKDVLEECGRTERGRTERGRTEKWWETYVSQTSPVVSKQRRQPPRKQQKMPRGRSPNRDSSCRRRLSPYDSNVPTWPEHPQRQQEKRPMSPLFQQETQRPDRRHPQRQQTKRPMSPLFQSETRPDRRHPQRQQAKRPMSPLFQQETRQQDRRHSQRQQAKRPMSPLFQQETRQQDRRKRQRRR